jgi:hypothetical protein
MRLREDEEFKQRLKSVRVKKIEEIISRKCIASCKTKKWDEALRKLRRLFVEYKKEGKPIPAYLYRTFAEVCYDKAIKCKLQPKAREQLLKDALSFLAVYKKWLEKAMIGAKGKTKEKWLKIYWRVTYLYVCILYELDYEECYEMCKRLKDAYGDELGGKEYKQKFEEIYERLKRRIPE